MVWRRWWMYWRRRLLGMNLFTAERYRLQPEFKDGSKPPSTAHSAAKTAADDVTYAGHSSTATLQRVGHADMNQNNSGLECSRPPPSFAFGLALLLSPPRSKHASMHMAVPERRSV